MKLIVLIIYFAILIGIGFYCRKHATVGPWLTAFAYGTSSFSAVVFVGYAGQFGWRFGIAATWAGIGNAILGSLLAWMILGRRTRVMSQHLDSATMPQFFGQRFQSPSLKIAASAIIFVFLIPYTASLYNGLSRLFGMAFHIDYSVCIIIMAVLTGVYVIGPDCDSASLAIDAANEARKRIEKKASVRVKLYDPAWTQENEPNDA